MKNNRIRVGVSMLLATIFIGGMIYTTKANLFIPNTCALWIIAWIYLIGFYYFVSLGVSIKTMHKLSISNYKFRIYTFLISLIIVLVFPYKYGEVLTDNYIEKMRYEKPKVNIQVISEGEIFVNSIKLNKRDYNIYEIPLDNINWYFNEGKIYNPGTNEQVLEIRFEKGDMFELKFDKMPLAGTVKISQGDFGYELNLRSEKVDTVLLDWEQLYGTINEAPAMLRMGYYGIYLLLLWTLIDAGMLALVAGHQKRKEESKVEV